MLDFQTPRGLRLQISSLAAPNFATSYTLGNVGVVDGSVSYLYSSLPLQRKLKSSELDLHNVIRGYRQLRELRRPDDEWWWEIWHNGKRIDRRSRPRQPDLLLMDDNPSCRHPPLRTHIPPTI